MAGYYGELLTGTPSLSSPRRIQDLPSADVLRKYLFVITSTRRIMHEARQYTHSCSHPDYPCSPSLTLRRGRRIRLPRDSHEIGKSWLNELDTSPLQKILWLRVVVDEGHVLGTSVKTQVSGFVRKLEARYRWIMSQPQAKKWVPGSKKDTGLQNRTH